MSEDNNKNIEISKNEMRAVLTEDKHEILIAALLTTKSLTEAAQKVGISRQTLSACFNHDKAFIKKYKQTRQMIVDTAVARMQQLSLDAVEVLTTNLKCGNPLAEIRAAKIILELGMRGSVMVDFDARLENIENLFREKVQEKVIPGNWDKEV